MSSRPRGSRVKRDPVQVPDDDDDEDIISRKGPAAWAAESAAASHLHHLHQQPIAHDPHQGQGQGDDGELYTTAGGDGGPQVFEESLLTRGLLRRGETAKHGQPIRYQESHQGRAAELADSAIGGSQALPGPLAQGQQRPGQRLMASPGASQRTPAGPSGAGARGPAGLHLPQHAEHQHQERQEQSSLVPAVPSSPNLNYPGHPQVQAPAPAPDPDSDTDTESRTPGTRHHQPLHQLQLPGRHTIIHPPYVLLATPPADIVAPPYPPPQQEHQQQEQQFRYQHHPQQHLGISSIAAAGDPTDSPPPQSSSGALLCHPHDPRLLQPHLHSQQQHQHEHNHQHHHAQPTGYFPPDASAATDLHPLEHHQQQAQLVTASASVSAAAAAAASSSQHQQQSYFPTPLEHPDHHQAAAVAAAAASGLAQPSAPGDDPITTPFHDQEQIQQFYQQLPNNWPLYQRPDGLWLPLMHPELSSILNAESYNDGTSTFRAPRSLPPPQQPQQQTTNIGVDVGVGIARHSLKRSQGQITDAVEWADEPVKKRARGRPKLTNNGEAAADRRREQIRNAQRAYRNRKEEAITGLEKKVQQLTQHKEQMSTAFMEFHDFITSHGLISVHPEMARQLHVTTEKFFTLARAAEDGDKHQGAAGGDGGADSEGNSASPASGSGKHPAIPSSPGPSTGRDKILMAGLIVTHEPDPDYAPPPAAAAAVAHRQQNTSSSDWSQGGPSSSTASSHQVSSAAPCEVISQPTVHNASFPFGMSNHETALETNSFSIDTASFMHPAYATPPSVFPSPPPLPLNLESFMPPHLPPPSTLSYQERTFGRRLHRAALEQGLRLLSMANAPPHFLAGVFGFCLLFESREMIMQRLTDCLSINQQETLYNWRFPFLHLGGAGTFFEQQNEMDDTVLSQSVQGAVVDHVRAGFGFGGGAQSATAAAATPGQALRRYQQGMPRTAIGNRGLTEPHRSKVAPDSLFGQGPWSAAVETAKDIRVDRKLRIMVPGWEGDFFDCDEIEWYLQQRGIVIPPAADVIAAEIDEDAFTTSESFGPTKAFDRTIDNVIVDWLTRDFVQDGPGAAVAATLATPSSSTDTRGRTTPMGETDLARAEAQFSASQRDVLQARPAVAAPGKKLITLNVDLLVQELVGRSVCLGRTPGVRPKDVDAAFWNSVTLVA